MGPPLRRHMEPDGPQVVMMCLMGRASRHKDDDLNLNFTWSLMKSFASKDFFLLLGLPGVTVPLSSGQRIIEAEMLIVNRCIPPNVT